MWGLKGRASNPGAVLEESFTNMAPILKLGLYAQNERSRALVKSEATGSQQR